MDEPITESVWDDVDNTWLRNYTGLSIDAAVGKAQAEGRPVRVLRPGSDVTLDFCPDRLNLHVDANGDLRELTAG